MPRRLDILVVDDHADTRTCLEALLGLLGHVAVCAEDGQAALRLSQTRRFDLLITDVALPGIDGWELLRRLDLEGQPLPRKVSMSSFATPEDLRLSKAAGCDLHLSKPLRLQSLVDALGSFVS